MKKILLLALAITIVAQVSAQDVGNIEVKERIAKSKSIFIGGGLSKTFGKNIGDYSQGINFEVGYLKRVNRILSIGPSFSFIKFDYDPDKTDVNGGAYVGFISDINDPDYWEGYVINLEGGDITLMSLSFNLKINFIPITDATKVSIYGFAKPFITSAKKTNVYGEGDYYRTDDPDGLTNWRYISTESWGPESFPALKEETNFTGGIFIGPGIEFLPAGGVSIFVQAAFGYTFPVNFVSTSAWEPTIDSYVNDEFPIVKKGFPSLNLQAGLSFNF